VIEKGKNRSWRPTQGPTKKGGGGARGERDFNYVGCMAGAGGEVVVPVKEITLSRLRGMNGEEGEGQGKEADGGPITACLQPLSAGGSQRRLGELTF